jgi:hypothetical protein
MGSYWLSSAFVLALMAGALLISLKLTFPEW